MITLYHGTDIESAKNICKGTGINLSLCNDKTDFGKGFYTTDNFERAAKWAYRKAAARMSKPAVVTILFDNESAQPIIEHFEDDLRWGRFIINNRNGLSYIKNVPFKDHNLDARYQITLGRVADIDVVDVATELKKENSMLVSLDRILNIEYPQQLVFHTKQSLEYIVKLSYRSI